MPRAHALHVVHSSHTITYIGTWVGQAHLTFLLVRAHTCRRRRGTADTSRSATAVPTVPPSRSACSACPASPPPSPGSFAAPGSSWHAGLPGACGDPPVGEFVYTLRQAVKRAVLQEEWLSALEDIGGPGQPLLLAIKLAGRERMRWKRTCSGSRPFSFSSCCFGMGGGLGMRSVP